MKDKKVGIIDIGSHSVLLLIAKYEAHTGWQAVDDRVKITRLGEGFEGGAMLQSAAIERTLKAVDEFLAVCEANRVQSVTVVGTAVLRQAVNRQEFADALLERGLNLRVLSGQEEATYSYLSVRNDPAIWNDTLPQAIGSEPGLAVIDIGGGSVEVAYGTDRMREWFSFPVGALRIREEWMPANPPSRQEILEACVKLDEIFAPLKRLPTPTLVVTVGGTGVALAAIHQQLDTYDASKLHAFELESEHIGKLLERLNKLSDWERRQLKGMDAERAPVIHAGALILERVLFAVRQERVVISVRGLRYGLLP